MAYLFGEGGVWRDIVGTPVVGVLWLGNWVPCVKLRFNWGLLLLMPLIEKPSAPSKWVGKETMINWCSESEYMEFLLASQWFFSTISRTEDLYSLCGPYKLAPSCDNWPDDDGEGDGSIWKPREVITSHLNLHIFNTTCQQIRHRN